MNNVLLADAPGEWRRTTLATACSDGGSIQTGPFGSQLHASDYVIEGIPSIMPQDIGENVVRDDEIARITPADAQRLSKYLVRSGDIVYSRRGDVTRRALVQPEQEGWLCGTGCLRVRPGAGVDSVFLSYYLGHPEVRAWITRHAVGATMPNLNTQILGAVPVVLPEPPEQRAIAALLGTLDDKIAVNGRITTMADELSRTRFHGVTVNSPERFTERALSDTAEFINGRAFTKDATGTGRMVVRIAEINSGPGSSTVYNDLDVPEKHLARPGDVLFAWSGSLTVARWFRPAAIINQHIFKCVPKNGYPQWLVSQLVHRKIDEFRAIAADKATTMGHIQRAHLDEPVHVPTAEALLELDTHMGPLWERALLAERESLTLAHLRDALLPQLMSGRLRVKEAEKLAEDYT